MMEQNFINRWRSRPISVKHGYVDRCSCAQQINNIESTGKRRQEILSEEGAALVEIAISLAVLLTVLFGIIEMSLALYSFHYISSAAREGTRWAIVRGSTSCTNTPDLTDCDATADDIQSHVQNLGYPLINASSTNPIVSTTWLKANTSDSTTTWISCGTVQCNAPGNAVQVTVKYAFPLNIPFWKSMQLHLSSTSQMVISQ